MMFPTVNPDDNKKYVGFLAFAIGFLILGLGLRLFAPFFEPMAWAIILALFSYPIHQRIRRYLRGRNNLSAVIMTVLIIAFIVIPVFFLLGSLTNETFKVYASIQERLHGQGLGLIPDLESFPILKERFPQLIELARGHEEAIRETIADLSKRLGEILIAQGTVVFKNVASLIFKAFIMLTIFFYLLRDGDRLLASFKELLPFSDRETANFFRVTHDVLSATLYGNIMTAFVQASLGIFILWALDFSAPILWGIVMGVATFIPMVGTALVWIPATVYLVAAGLYVKAAVLLGFSLLVISQIDYFLRPYLIGGKIQIHNLFLLLSIIGGINLFGFLGLVLGPIVIALCLSVLEIYKLNYLGKSL